MDERHHQLSKRRESFTERHSFTTQKARLLLLWPQIYVYKYEGKSENKVPYFIATK
jgi:hypothetical protein